MGRAKVASWVSCLGAVASVIADFSTAHRSCSQRYMLVECKKYVSFIQRYITVTTNKSASYSDKEGVFIQRIQQLLKAAITQ